MSRKPSDRLYESEAILRQVDSLLEDFRSLGNRDDLADDGTLGDEDGGPVAYSRPRLSLVAERPKNRRD